MEQLQDLIEAYLLEIPESLYNATFTDLLQSDIENVLQRHLLQLMDSVQDTSLLLKQLLCLLVERGIIYQSNEENDTYQVITHESGLGDDVLSFIEMNQSSIAGVHIDDLYKSLGEYEKYQFLKRSMIIKSVTILEQEGLVVLDKKFITFCRI